MNKRNLLFWIVFLWCVFGILTNRSYAQEYTQDDLKDIVVRFCDKLWDLEFKKTVYAEPWKENTVRFCIYNNWIKKIPISYWFYTAVFNWVWTRLCEENTQDANHEWSLIPKRNERTVIIDPQWAKMIEEQIIIPPGINTWIQMWCLAAEIGGNVSNINMGAMFMLKVRKAFDLDIVVWGMAAIENNIKVLNTTWWSYSTNKQVKAEIDSENTLKISFLVENAGNIAQNITITGKVYNALGFEREFTVNSQVPPTVTNQITADVGLLPAYKWLFSVKYYIQNDPQFTFDVGQELKKSWYLSGMAKIFIFSWIRVIAVIAALFIIYRVFVPRRGKRIETPAPSVSSIPSA